VFAAIQQVTYVAVVAWGAVLVADREMTMGALIACTILTGRVTSPLIGQFPNFLVQWGYARSSLRSLDSILALPVDHASGASSLRPERLPPSIDLDAVQFAYDAGKPVIDIGSLGIRAGERVAVIGGIGSGKSTLLRLIAGLYAPAAGSVRVGGLDVTQIAPDILRRDVGYLPQDTRLLNGTLRQNLLLGLGNPGDEALVRAIEEVGLAPFVASHPRGVDLPIAEGGRGLSGGQRTLANLARLFLLNPDLLLLDEPTANLDQASEYRVIAALMDRMKEGRTLVLVTHRPQLLSLSNRVIVLHGGRIVEDGPTDSILAKLTAHAGARAAEPVAASAAP
jgi:ATP-binding cassette subfamily C protein LapB